MTSLADDHDAMTIRRMRRVMALFTGLLVASTWPLWTPDTPFPDIPWLAWAVNWPPEKWDWFWLMSLGGLLILQFAPRRLEGRRLIFVRYGLFAGALMLLPTDQHRLQPWVWQMLVMTLVIAVAGTAETAVRCLRWLVISIYVWSAVSKFDMAFIDGLGVQMLHDFLSVKWNLTYVYGWSEPMQRTVVSLFPVGELVIAILLMFRRTRLLGLIGALAMHGWLMLLLGPLGLDHLPGVVIWNVYFGIQAWLLFWPRPSRVRSTDQSTTLTAATWTFTVTVCLLPAFSLIGSWDWWPSWAVYSARPESAFAVLSRDDVHSGLPHHQSMMGPSDFGPQRHIADLHQWSFDVCHCPLYPQGRYVLALINAAIHRRGSLQEVTFRHSPDRRTGEVAVERWTPDEFEAQLGRFWFNIEPRRVD